MKTTEYHVTYTVMSPSKRARWVRLIGPCPTLAEARAKLAVVLGEKVESYKITATTTEVEIVEEKQL